MFFIGIAGGSGAGKTTLAGVLAELLAPQAVVVCLDGYYRSIGGIASRELDAYNWDHPDAVDFAAVSADLERLRCGKAVPARSYDYEAHGTVYDGTRLHSTAFVIVEGALLFVDPGVRARFDLRVFVEVEESVRCERRIVRDVFGRGQAKENVVRQITSSVLPMHDQFVAPCAAYADLVVNGDEDVEISAKQVLSCIAPDR